MAGRKMAEKGVLLRTNYTGETRYTPILGHVFQHLTLEHPYL
ncbi:hypothetical protein RMB03_18310 [Acinetobacter sp. V91_7]|nr:MULTISPECIES: hypothetical protein [unclassified Acinetobacter]MDS7933298.1 hypothetical protein [Acinetobacter sp. V91_4B]MDS7964902.1 hypothetical protein [Acinetobacter sp. V91_7]MDS8027891.1 hypothetical protein [Acinetobacter sp. V91_13]